MTHRLHTGESPTGAGRGVFASEAIAAGATIEICPMLVATNTERSEALALGAEGYVFGWGDGGTALALGYGSLYNHSYEPNATTLEDAEDEVLVITAVRDIAPGEEIFINYMGTADSGVWFDDLTA